MTEKDIDHPITLLESDESDTSTGIDKSNSSFVTLGLRPPSDQEDAGWLT